MGIWEKICLTVMKIMPQINISFLKKEIKIYITGPEQANVF